MILTASSMHVLLYRKVGDLALEIVDLGIEHVQDLVLERAAGRCAGLVINNIDFITDRVLELVFVLEHHKDGNFSKIHLEECFLSVVEALLPAVDKVPNDMDPGVGIREFCLIGKQLLHCSTAGSIGESIRVVD